MRCKYGTVLPIVITLTCGQAEVETPALRAFGNEPFWSVTISEVDGIVYSRLGEEDVAFPYESPSYATRDTPTFTIGPLEDDEGERTIEIVISEEPCQDTMADTVHPMRAIVVVDGEELRGCARRPGDSPAEEVP